MFRFLLLIVSFVFALQSCSAQSVIRYEGQANLEDRLDWARNAAQSKGLPSFRFGFAILRDAEPNSRIGRYWNSEGRTLAQILNSNSRSESDLLHFREVARTELARLSGASEGRSVRRPVAVLLKFSSTALELQEVFVADYDSHSWFEDELLMWGGEASDSDALALATNLYQSVSSGSLRENLVPVVGILDPSEQSFGVLANILNADSSPDVRQQAVFWIGRHGTDGAYSTVLSTIASDEDEDVREHAVFVLSRFRRDVVFDELERIARSSNQSGVSEQARFWLGRRIVGESPGTQPASSEYSKVQRQALYALYGDDENDDSVRALAELAESAASQYVRREAIMMLSRSGRPAALDALVAIHRE